MTVFCLPILVQLKYNRRTIMPAGNGEPDVDTAPE